MLLPNILRARSARHAYPGIVRQVCRAAAQRWNIDMLRLPYCIFYVLNTTNFTYHRGSEPHILTRKGIFRCQP
jgi:hypothetical protein